MAISCVSPDTLEPFYCPKWRSLSGLGLTWQAVDPLSRPTIVLSGLASLSRIAGHFEGARSSVV